MPSALASPLALSWKCGKPSTRQLPVKWDVEHAILASDLPTGAKALGLVELSPLAPDGTLARKHWGRLGRGALCRAAGISWSSFTRHMRTLESAGLFIPKRIPVWWADLGECVSKVRVFLSPDLRKGQPDHSTPQVIPALTEVSDLVQVVADPIRAYQDNALSAFGSLAQVRSDVAALRPGYGVRLADLCRCGRTRRACGGSCTR